MKGGRGGREEEEEEEEQEGERRRRRKKRSKRRRVSVCKLRVQRDPRSGVVGAMGLDNL